MDGAVVNVSIGKRGDLAAMAARSVREEAASFEAAMKARRAAHRVKFAEAKALIEAVSKDRMAELGRPHKLTARQARAKFIETARINPDLLIQTMSREVGR